MLHLGSSGMIRALALGEILVRRSWSLSTVDPTPQTVFQAFEVVAPALRLLASDPDPLRLPTLRRSKIPIFSNAAMTFSMFGAHRQAERETPVLEALEASLKPELSVADRSVLLIELGIRADRVARKPPAGGMP
jgi:hypothetical protein